MPAKTAAFGQQNPSRFSLAMSPRDLINVGIFAAIYLVVVYAFGVFGFVSPVVMIVALAASIVAGGIPFLLFLSRVRHAGMVVLFTVIWSGVLLVTGHPLVSFALCMALSVVVEVIVWFGRYRARWSFVISYAVYAAWYIGPLLPLFYARDEYFRSSGMDQLSPEYIEQMNAVFSTPVLIGFAIATVVLGFLGGLLGLRLLRKHFAKAGLA